MKIMLIILIIDEKIGEDYENVYVLRLPDREVKEFFKQKFIGIIKLYKI